MRFVALPVGEAVGAVVAHTERAGDLVVKKGSIVTREIADGLAAAGVRSVVVAVLEAGDIGEDDAARQLAQAAAGPGLRPDRAFTGRCNLFAQAQGLLVVDAKAIAAVNAVDEAVTLATLPAFAPVEAGTMAATVKIIPYAVPGATLDAALAAARGALRIAPYAGLRAAYVATVTQALKPTVRAKTREVTAARLAACGASLASDEEVPHEAAALAAVLRRLARSDIDLVVIFGASAIADRQDVVPAALEAAGGRVERLGMPVDPGNLLLLGELAGRPVIGAPGCARSPKENGFDWVLRRLCAGLPVNPADIQAMGVGGLLMEIRSRPQPREGGA